MSKISEAIQETKAVEKRRNKKNPAFQQGFMQKLLNNERIDLQYGHAHQMNPGGVIKKLHAGYFNYRNRMR